MRRRAIALILVAVALAILAIAGKQRLGTAPDASPTTPRTDAAPPSASVLAPAPRPEREPAAKPVRSAPPKGSFRVRVLAAGAPAVGATVRSGGWLTERLHPRPGEVTITTDEDGVVEIDTSGMSFLVNLDNVAEGLDKAGIVQVVSVDATLEGWSSGHAKVELGPARAVGDVPDVTIELRRLATIVGRILAPDGTPIGATAQAVADEDTPPEGTHSLGDGVVAGDDGRFRLAVDAEGAALLLVGRGDARPFTTPVTLVRGAVVDVGDVRLDRGASLAGRVRCRGVAPARTTVIATWYGPAFETARPAGHGLLWVVDRRAIWSQLEIHPDAEGRFRIDGLEPGPYRLRVPTEDWGCALHPDAYAEVDRIVRAPDERIEVDADRSLFVLDVVDATTAVGWPWIDVEGQDAITIEGEATGHAGVVLRAGARHRVTVRARGYAASTLDVTAAEAGGRRHATVSLTKARLGEPAASPPYAREGGVLRARVVGPDGVPFRVAFRLFDDQGTLLRAFARDPRAREGTIVRSATRTGVGELFTSFGPSDTKPARGTVEVGGGLVETKRLDFDAVAEETDAGKPGVVLLHAR